MTRRSQYGCVLAALLICLAVTVVHLAASTPVPRPVPAGGDDIPFPTSDVPTWDRKSSSARSRTPASIVPEGVAMLLATVVWTAARGLLAGRVNPSSSRQSLTTLGHRRIFG
jgi:hypothetical protein